MSARSRPVNARARRGIARALARFVLAPCALTALAAAARAEPPITLVETRPVETRLGNPELPEALHVWLDLIARAERTLDLEHFYCSDWPDEPLRPVLDEIGRAAARGVKVRLLLDRRMHDTYPMPADSLGRVPGIELRTVDFRRVAGGVQHAKFFLVDGHTAFVGSQNLDWRALKHIHELGVRVRDQRVAAAFGHVFEMDWAAAGASDGDTLTLDTLAVLRDRAGRAAIPEMPLTVVQAPGDTARVWPAWSPRSFVPDASLWDRDAIVRLLDGARREIVVQLLVYSPEDRGLRDTALDDALRRAAARGVKVRLLASDWMTDGSHLPELQALVGVRRVEVRLSTVPEWSGGYIPFARVEHCKYAVVDGARMWIGTGNWEPGYFHASRNLALVIDNRRLAAQARRIFETSWKAPGARRLRAGVTYPRKIRGTEPPPGKTVYGN
jgi:phosphatidylserine/phosphatidylglycerophosphate/cardiolipin synthase-like enzyme